MVTTRATLKSIIRTANNKFVGLTFVKKDGSVRRLNGRMNIASKTGAAPTVAGLSEYLTIFDMQARNYRNVNMDTIQSIRTGGVELFVN